jgi:hypothetical protein
MTMQMAIQAKGRAIVFASDTKIRTADKALTSDGWVPDKVVNHGKVVISSRHDIAVALAGNSDQYEDPAQELADYLAEQDNIPDFLGPLLVKWGNEYFQKKFPGQKHEFPLCQLLVVNPKCQYCQLWRLLVSHNSHEQSSERYILNGNARSAVVFWPEYFRCDKTVYDLHQVTAIAATTILMEGELNPYGVGGLEVWQFDGTWNLVPPVEIERLANKFKDLRESLRLAVS